MDVNTLLKYNFYSIYLNYVDHLSIEFCPFQFIIFFPLSLSETRIGKILFDNDHNDDIDR